MKKRVLGGNLEVSAIGVGCMGLSHAEGAPAEEGEAIRFLREAAEVGYTFFDTAETYGFPEDPHHNEKLVGKAFEGMRDQVVIASKFGVAFDYAARLDRHPLIVDSKPDTIRRSIEGTLRRLRTDHVDMYYQHRIDPEVEPEVVAETVGELIAEGKVLNWGISTVGEEYLRRAHAVTPVAAVENMYNLTDRSQERMFGVFDELGIGLVVHCPLAKGLLTGTFSKGTTFEAGDYRAFMVNDESINRTAELVGYLRELGDEKGVTPGQLSLAWLLAKRPYVVPIPGMRKQSRLAENAGAADVVLTAEEVARIDELSAPLQA